MNRTILTLSIIIPILAILLLILCLYAGGCFDSKKQTSQAKNSSIKKIVKNVKSESNQKLKESLTKLRDHLVSMKALIKSSDLLKEYQLDTDMPEEVQKFTERGNEIITTLNKESVKELEEEVSSEEASSKAKAIKLKLLEEIKSTTTPETQPGLVQGFNMLNKPNKFIMQDDSNLPKDVYQFLDDTARRTDFEREAAAEEKTKVTEVMSPFNERLNQVVSYLEGGDYTSSNEHLPPRDFSNRAAFAVNQFIRKTKDIADKLRQSLKTP